MCCGCRILFGVHAEQYRPLQVVREVPEVGRASPSVARQPRSECAARPHQRVDLPLETGKMPSRRIVGTSLCRGKGGRGYDLATTRDACVVLWMEWFAGRGWAWCVVSRRMYCMCPRIPGYGRLERRSPVAAPRAPSGVADLTLRKNSDWGSEDRCCRCKDCWLSWIGLPGLSVESPRCGDCCPWVVYPPELTESTGVEFGVHRAVWIPGKSGKTGETVERQAFAG